MAAQYKTDYYPWMKDLVRTAVNDTQGGLSGVCDAAGCKVGLHSVGNWLDGLVSKTTGERKYRALPEKHAVPLMRWLAKQKRYEAEIVKARKEALDWFHAMKDYNFDRLDFADVEGSYLKGFAAPLDAYWAYWHVTNWLTPKPTPIEPD